MGLLAASPYCADVMFLRKMQGIIYCPLSDRLSKETRGTVFPRASCDSILCGMERASIFPSPYFLMRLHGIAAF